MTMPNNDGSQAPTPELAVPPATPAPAPAYAPEHTSWLAQPAQPAPAVQLAPPAQPAQPAPAVQLAPPAPAAPASMPDPASWLAQPTPVPSAVTAPPAPSELSAAPAEGLNLDTLEREGGPTQPFRFTLDGHSYMLSDPNELDWQTLLAVAASPLRLIQSLLPADDQERFYTTRLPAWKLERLLKGYMEHYGLPPLESASGSPA